MAISYRYQATGKTTSEERQTDSAVLLVLLIASIFDISGGLWALTVLLVVADRSIRFQHGFIQILVAPVVLFIGIVSTSVIHPQMLGGGILVQIPYLGGNSNLLGDDVLPRWTTILLAIMCLISVVRHRKITTPKSEYTPYLPIFWILIIIAVIVPDGRYVPPILTIFATVTALRSGYLGWFWFNPFAAMWSAFCIMEMSFESEFTNLEPYTGALTTFGLVAFVQYIVYLRGDLHRWIDNDRIEPDDDFNLGQPPSSFSPFGIYNRLLGYSAFIIFPSEEMYDFLPAVRVLMMSVLAYDLYRNKSAIGLRIWVLPMTFFSIEFLDHLTYDPSTSTTSWSHLGTLVLISSGLYQLYKSYVFEDEVGASNSGWATGTIGTVYALFGILFFVNGHDLQQNRDLAALSGFAMVAVFGHHLVLGFNRNEGWRRLMSLFGLPVGIIFTGFELGELFGIVALFLAAMTMIAQGIMYSARGGLGMGSVKEGAEHLDPVRVLEVTGFGSTLQISNQNEVPASKDTDDLPPNITELEKEEKSADDDVLEIEEKTRESISIETETVDEIVQDEIKEIPRKVSDVRFPIFGSDLEMEITGGMVSRIAGVVATGNPGYVPIIRIDDAGIVSIQWESARGSTQSE